MAPIRLSSRAAALRNAGPTRRQVLQAGLLGGFLLAGSQFLAVRAVAQTGGPAFGFLTAGDATILRAIAPVVLDGALPTAAAERESALGEVLAGIDFTILRMAPAVQDEVRQLFDMLGFAPARVVLAGLWSGWDAADPKAVEAALLGLRDSRFGLKRSVYNVLHDLPLSAWYANPRSWARIGYDGPPAIHRA